MPKRQTTIELRTVRRRHKPAAGTPSRTLTVTEAAAILGISRTSAYECVHAGTIPSIRLGGRIVIPRATFDEMLDSA